MSSITPNEDPHDGFKVTIDPRHQEPIPAEIVSDRRNLLGKRLAVAGTFGLILFLLISAYKQVVENGHRPTPKPPVVTITTGPGVPPSPLLTPFPVPSILIVTSPGPRETFEQSPRGSSTSRPATASPRPPKPSPSLRPSPSPTCLLPAPVPCI